MFKNLKKILTEKNITNKDLAEFLRLSEKTIQNKMLNNTEWTLSEINQISKFLCPEYKVDWLFSIEDKTA